ncbi:MAG: O-antigen ligase family protein [Clostridia bacterium]|nr:O-antigen ligase family protein [Clostridia bacterium]
MKKFFEFIKNNLLLIILALQPILDILAYVQRGSAVSFAGYFRLLLTLLLPAYTLFFAKERKKFIISMLVIGVFSGLHILNCFRVGYLSIFTDVKYLLLVAHAIVLLYSFMFLYDKKENLRQIKTALMIMIPTVAITYYISYFLKNGSYTYIHSQIGWTGWNNTPSVFSIILSALFPFIVYFCVKGRKKWSIIFLVPLSFMYIMNGTKAAYLTLIGSLFCCFVFVIAEYFIKKKEKFPVLVAALMAVLLIGSISYYNYSPRLDIDTLNNESLEQGEEMLEGEEDELGIENLEENFAKSLDKKMIRRFGLDRYLSYYEGNMNAESLANNRLKKIIFGSLVWEDTDIITKFVGFEHTLMYIGNDSYDLESDPQAIYFYYGYLGAALYAGVLIYFWLRLIKQLLCHFKESFNLFNFVIFINYGLLMVSTLYTGHLLRRPNSAIYLTIVLLLIYCRTEPLFKRKKQIVKD